MVSKFEAANDSYPLKKARLCDFALFKRPCNQLILANACTALQQCTLELRKRMTRMRACQYFSVRASNLPEIILDNKPQMSHFNMVIEILVKIRTYLFY